MSLQENIALVNRMTEAVWNAGSVDAIDEFYSPDYVGHDPSGPMDLEQLKQALAGKLEKTL